MTEIVSLEQPNKPILTVSDVIDAYMRDRENPYAERVCKNPKSIGYHFIPIRAVWGEMTVEAFKDKSKARVKAQGEEWRRAGWKQGTLRKRVSQLKTAFKFCVEEELLPSELMPVIKLPAQGPARERVLTMEELSRLLWYADQPETECHIRLNLHLSLRTGQRQSAQRDLKWENVDFTNRVVRYRDTETPDERSKKRRTSMPMDDALLAILTEAKENAETEWVLERHGRRVLSTYAGMKALYKRASIEGVHRHDLRRTAATLAHIGTGGDMKAAAGFIGDTEAMAQKHYVHSGAETRLAPVIAISDVLAAARRRA